MTPSPPPAWRPTPRDPRLHGLGSDHHHALVMVRGLRRRLEAGAPEAAWNAAEASALAARFDAELEPHFLIEDRLILPALAALRQPEAAALAARLAGDHAALRTLAPATPSASDAVRFADLLEAHVRFEERELFPFLERHAPSELLDAIAEAAPKPSRNGANT